MSVANVAGGFVFVSALRGHPPGEPDAIPETTEGQARQAFDNLRALMEHLGGSLDDVVRVTVYFGNLDYRDDFHRVWMEYWPDNPPARIAVKVADANTRPGRNAHFALDAMALDPSAG
jgi:2-iminobutanoate/2-iminopropanoate deaminase